MNRRSSNITFVVLMTIILAIAYNAMTSTNEIDPFTKLHKPVVVLQETGPSKDLSQPGSLTLIGSDGKQRTFIVPGDEFTRYALGIMETYDTGDTLR